jgi:DNA-binding GntR family transcriptional regulator
MEQARIARSNAEDAYQAIKKLIVTVELPPGSPFTEGELVKRIGLGKTPVREALLRLKLENLIAVQPRSGYRVVPVTLKDVRDACQLLGYLEAQTAAKVAAHPGSPARLERRHERLEQAAAADEDGQPLDGWIRADWQFHLDFARSQDNQFQVDVMTRLNQLVLRFRYLAIALGIPGRKLAHEHGDLLAAVGDADSAAAVAATRDIWRETEAGLVGLLSETDSVQSANVWSGRDKNAFYLDAVPPGPSIPDVFEPRLPTGAGAGAGARRRRPARSEPAEPPEPPDPREPADSAEPAEPAEPS